jgi:type IV secretory pathway TraG/TraD family ATPase VirD4
MSTMVTKFATKLLKIKLYLKLLLRLGLIIFALQVAVIVIYNTWFNHHWTDTKELITYGLNLVWTSFTDLNLNQSSDYLARTWELFWHNQKWVWLSSFSVWLSLPLLMSWMHISEDEVETKREYIQGRQFITPKQLNNLLVTGAFNKERLLPLGEVYLPYADENKQTFAVGKPGSGKTNMLNQILLKIRELKRKAIIHDYKGDYVEKFYNPTADILFNPLDERSVGWCLFNDCQSIMDIDAFAYALIPQTSSNDPYWNNAARDVFTAILRYCWNNNLKTNAGIWQIATMPNDMLYEMLSNTHGGQIAAKHLEDPQGKTAMGVMSNMIQYVKVFEYMTSMDGDFSIRRWVSNHDEAGMIFVTNYAKLQNTLRPIISLFLQTAGSNLLSLSDDLTRRVYMILDEFGQLPNINTIESLMTASRSKGGAVFIGVQDIGQLDKIYKKETRSTILNSASNRLIFNCKDRETAKFFSNDIGETEYWELVESQSISMNKGDRVNANKQRHKEFLVTPEDIQSVPDLNAFVSIGGNNVTLSKWEYKKLSSIAQAFVQRSDLNLINTLDVMPMVAPPINVVNANTMIVDEDHHYNVVASEDDLLDAQMVDDVDYKENNTFGFE